MKCTICSNTMKVGVKDWHFICNGCGYENANLTLKINELDFCGNIDEKSREIAFKSLRKLNNKTLINKIRYNSNLGKTLLEVGSAHGWFLEEAMLYYEVKGIEPDTLMFQKSTELGLSISNGYFPNCLMERDRFDIIVFNDVFEHIPSLSTLVQACINHLNRDGLLVINLPNSNGFIYKTSKFLTHFRIFSIFERMWQVSFPSPHLHYFNFSNLEKILSEAGFTLIVNDSLPPIRFRGLYERVSYAGKRGKIVNCLLYVSLLFILPIITLFPSDTIYVIYRKN